MSIPVVSLLSEEAVNLILTSIKTNIAPALASIRSYWDDGTVTTEPPPTSSYFIYPKAQGYRCPAIWVVDEGTDFRKSETKANFIDALMSINVSVKVEDKDQYKLAIKCWRYVSALYSILEESNLVSSDGAVKIVVKVNRVKAGPMYTIENDDPDVTAQFFKEYELFCDVEFYQGFS